MILSAVSPHFVRGKSFPQKRLIHSVEGLHFFHKLKTLWKMWKIPAVKPVSGVEFNTFHHVFHRRILCSLAKGVQFVIFKSELWQFFEAESVRFCNFHQHHFDECGFVLKTQCSRFFGRCCIADRFLLFFVWSDSLCPLQIPDAPVIPAEKAPVWIDFKRRLGYTNHVGSLNHAQCDMAGPEPR